jgi:hypothetical protein
MGPSILMPPAPIPFATSGSTNAASYSGVWRSGGADFLSTVPAAGKFPPQI